MKFIYMFFLTFLFNSISGQNSPYELNWKLDGPLLGAGVGLSVGSFLMTTTKNDLTLDEITLLDAGDINAFDRGATERYSSAFRTNSDVLFYSAGIMPFGMLIPKRTRKDFVTIGVMGLESFFLTNGLTVLTKTTVLRTRPLVYNPEVPLDEKYPKTNRFSFFSGHTSITAVYFFYKANVILLETKGDHLDNADSAAKVRLGNKWASLAGSQFHYFMVFDNKELDGAYKLDKAKDLLRRL